MIIRAIKTRIFKEREKLVSFILEYYKNPKEGDVLVVTSKIVALAQGRTIPVDNTTKEKLIFKETKDRVQRTKGVWLTLVDGMLATSAGIDKSNGNGKYILLPKDSYAEAKKLHVALKRKFKLKNFGVLITDSRSVPLRAGAMGFAVGYAGFKGLIPLRGIKDIFGKPLKVSRTNVADSLATSAVLLMGEAGERSPIALIRKAPVIFTSKQDPKELVIPFKEDNLVPFFKKYK